ncbi:IS200/IS605 family element transposase accessory protein TnpB [Microcoleus sp. FACHB-SPT15]|uniref:RNA-guided endonuclease InsQ/TnpB family protein n=1 Tax=Microcoleus sp. FACHB-SPT15 TaxID=2692830 RepID=UPI00177F8B05|nr:RNA-guided endonuclease TnpB family protein [Microcoleus sp. FACHB-SPT15]MBD1807868.1 IS200/IS605 family element transposase accessory protein TnpB [Microcoleus sp. FACHB-SPT15]
MLHRAVKARLYPTPEQEVLLAQHFGCARWWWNFGLNKSIESYRNTGKGLGRSALNALLPKLKKDKETEWLGECYSQVLQAITLNLTTAYKNFFEGRARFPRFKSKHGRQSIQYPQNVKVIGSCLKLPGHVGAVKAKIHRPIEGTIKTVTVSIDPSGKYYASILAEIEGENPAPSTEGRVIGVDLGLKHFAVTSDGSKVSKYDNPRHLAKHEKNLKRKQQKLARKQKGSKSRNKYRKVVARVYERVSNSRADFLHKLSRKLVNENQVVVVENLHVKGMVHNHNLAKAISDVGWGMFTNNLAYKLERKGGKLIEIDRWFPSSKLCSNCYHQVDEMPLDVREWTCPHCNTRHDRDGNAATNIREEGIRLLQADGTSVSAGGGGVRPKVGRKSVLRHSPVKLETASRCRVRR